MRSRKLLALLFCLITFPAIAGYMTLLGAGVGSIAPVVSWVSGTDAFPSTLSFSRTSNATMFDSTGKLTYAPNNLLTYSNTFTDAVWNKSSVTVTGGVADPVSGSNASTITATGAGGILFQFPTVSAGTNVLTTFWVRRRTGTGNVWIRNAANTDVSILGTLTGTWTQFYVVAASNGAASAISMATSGDAIDIYAPTSSAVTYETTPRPGDQVITTASAYYGPRIDYDITGTLKGLLIEEARTWVALWNRDFTNAAWTKTSVTAALDQTGIDGVTNSASSLLATGANGTVLQNITLASSQRATSAYVKRLVGSGAVSMTTDGGATWTAITLTGSWVQQTIPAQTLANPSVGFKLATSGDKIAVDFFGNENGAFQTSALAVTTASVTRADDVVQFTGPALAALQGSAASLIKEWTSGVSAASNAYIFSAVGGAGLRIWTSTSYRLTNGTNTIDAVLPSGNIQQLQRTGFAFSGAGRSVVASGGTVATDANGAAMSGAIYLGSNTGSAAFINEHVKSFAIYNQRLPDATLQSKSVVGASYAANDNGIRYAFADNDNLPIHWRVAL